MKSFLPVILLSIALFLVVTPLRAGTCTSVAELSNLELANAMPARAESVLVARVAELGGPDSLLSRWADHISDPPKEAQLGYDGLPEFSLIVEAEIASAGIRTMVVAGSDFVEPVGVGVSSAEVRKVFLTKSSLEPVEERLKGLAAKDPEVDHAMDGELPFFRATQTKQSGWDGKKVTGDYYIAFPSPCSAVAAETTQELNAIAKALRGRDTGRFRHLAMGVDANAPLLVLREVKPPFRDGTQERIADVKELELGLALTDPTKPVFELTLRTSLQEDEALDYFEEAAFAFLMSEEDYRLQVAPAEGGFNGRLEIRPDPHEAYHLDLVTLWFFGLWMVI